MVEIIKSDILNESYEFVTLENGLKIGCYTMGNFNGVHGIIGTKFGSIDGKFILDGQEYDVPSGVAHFLEHKMFEKEYGDVFDSYSKIGANANAFTSFDKTCYLFTATNYIDEALDVLLELVTTPYFTPQTVEKEQGIIAQEIKMYDDNAHWRMLFGVLEGLFVNHTIKEDIAGTVESIAQITDKTLYDCTNAFYSPSQMTLCLAGNITMDTVLKACERANLKKEFVNVEKINNVEPDYVSYKEKSINMPIATPMVAVGFKEKFDEKVTIKQELIGDIVLEILTGATSSLFNKLYDENIVNGTFGGEIISGEDYFAFIISGETQNPQTLKVELEQAIISLKENGISQEEFLTSKNSMYGSLIVEFENVEEVATNMLTSHMNGVDVYEQINTLKQITLQDVNEQLKEMFDFDRKTVFTVNPMED